MPFVSMRFDLEELPSVTFYDFNEFLDAVEPDHIRNVYLNLVKNKWMENEEIRRENAQD